MKLSFYRCDIRVAFIEGAKHMLDDVEFREHQERILHAADKYSEKEEERQRMLVQEI